MSRKKEPTPSLRDQIKIYKSQLHGKSAQAFAEIMQSDSDDSLKAMFVKAKAAAERLKKEDSQ